MGPVGGGPHLLACAALLPDLVTAAASLCSPAPYDAEGLDWFAGFSPAAVDEVRLMFDDPAAARATFEEERQHYLATSPAELARELQAHSPHADLAFLTEEAACMQQALAAGIEGSWDDCGAQVTPWGFDLAGYRFPCCSCMADRTSPCRSATVSGWACCIPGVEARLLDNEGHGTLRETRIGDVHAWLTERS